MSYLFSPMNEENARIIVNWRYHESLNFYNHNLYQIEETVQEFVNPKNAYYSIFNNYHELVAYCCFGADARVKGGNYDIEALDIGFGMCPNLTRRGITLRIINAVFDFAQSNFSTTLFRVTVAEFNHQALRICQKAGFVQVQKFQREQDGIYFLVLLLKR
ncbi:GNAT family N-acetyltransferase [Plectonema cf. radiosum LEGE 06105]|uniref:GNAT family N-acetyltransferase n=1 Tax=Plectonema cf. radiosum LEGE 06105 TaxID=945769 RepID=A0A8J7EYN3_9CYAN|nr:GNAT family protein [Plectonema radiosum]MBE9211412.1 GNAT family N-acetyltransferase [Plectonema cf. radiosum LEGE 06105]